MQKDRELNSTDLKRRFIRIFNDHPIIVIAVVMIIGAILFGDFFH